ncbi:hypothetical protein PY32053_02887 [Paracoccus yeei]|uniref:Uncharacterized protein n=1 Tax=Paracoccus yeei TaxID=147645 RepID=A0A386UNX3_9RHOB|nr:hypothetical protein PY32053_02887 [Paracoccus yeei]
MFHKPRRLATGCDRRKPRIPSEKRWLAADCGAFALRLTGRKERPN